MIIKWRVGRNIVQVECTRETEKCVFTEDSRGNERRELKSSTWFRLFDTWEEAHAHLLEKVKKDVAGVKEHLQMSMEKLARIEAMEKPA